MIIRSLVNKPPTITNPIQGDMNTALNDLTNIIRHNQNQPRVYLARAEIYQKQGDITGAILNYSQVSLFAGIWA